MTINIKDFYLNTSMDRFEYMKLKLSDLPEDFVKLYNLASKVDKTVSFTSKSDAACMDSHKQAS